MKAVRAGNAMAATVLVVDDEPIVLEFVARALDRSGYDVLRASGSRQALEIVGRRPRVDLVLTDWQLPGMNGVELVRDQFLSKLEGFGVNRLEALGQPFDAAVHEAISTAPVTDPEQEGTVVAVVKEGYVVGDELLRPASVVVGSFRP